MVEIPIHIIIIIIIFCTHTLCILKCRKIIPLWLLAGFRASQCTLVEGPTLSLSRIVDNDMHVYSLPFKISYGLLSSDDYTLT